MLTEKCSQCSRPIPIQGSPHWDNNFCKAEQGETQEKASNARAVPIPPYDPIYGKDGPLCKIWKEAAKVK